MNQLEIDRLLEYAEAIAVSTQQQGKDQKTKIRLGVVVTGLAVLLFFILATFLY